MALKLGISTKSLVIQMSHQAMNDINERLVEIGGGFESFKECERAYSRVKREISRVIDGDVRQYPNDTEYELEIDSICKEDFIIKINKSLGKNPFGGFYQYGKLLSVKWVYTKKVRFAKWNTIRYFEKE